MVSPASVPHSHGGDVRQDVLLYIGANIDRLTWLSCNERTVYFCLLKLTNSLPGEGASPVPAPLWRLAEATGLSKGTVGQVLIKLAKLGLIERGLENNRDEGGNIVSSTVFVAPARDPFVAERWLESEPEGGRGVPVCPGCGSTDLEPLTYLRCKHCHYAVPKSQVKKVYPRNLWVVPSEPEPEPAPVPEPLPPSVPPPPSPENTDVPPHGVGVPMRGAAQWPDAAPAPLPERRTAWVTLPLPATAGRPWWPCDCGEWEWSTADREHWYCCSCGATALAEGLPP